MPFTAFVWDNMYLYLIMNKKTLTICVHGGIVVSTDPALNPQVCAGPLWVLQFSSSPMSCNRLTGDPKLPIGANVKIYGPFVSSVTDKLSRAYPTSCSFAPSLPCPLRGQVVRIMHEWVEV